MRKLKILDKSYAEMVVNYHLRNKSFLEKWEPVRSEEFYTKQYQEKQLDKALADIKNNNSLILRRMVPMQGINGKK